MITKEELVDTKNKEKKRDQSQNVANRESIRKRVGVLLQNHNFNSTDSSQNVFSTFFHETIFLQVLKGSLKLFLRALVCNHPSESLLLQ